MQKYFPHFLVSVYIGLIYSVHWTDVDSLINFTQQAIFIFLLWFLLFGIVSILVGSPSFKISASMALVTILVAGLMLYFVDREIRIEAAPYVMFWNSGDEAGETDEIADSSPQKVPTMQEQNTRSVKLRPKVMKSKVEYSYETISDEFMVIDMLRGANILTKPGAWSDKTVVYKNLPHGSNVTVIGKMQRPYVGWYVVALDKPGKIGFIHGRALNTPKTIALLKENSGQQKQAKELKKKYLAAIRAFRFPETGCEELPYVPQADASQRRIERAQHRYDEWIDCSINAHKQDYAAIRNLVINQLAGDFFSRDGEINFKVDNRCGCADDVLTLLHKVESRFSGRKRQRKKAGEAVDYFNAERTALPAEQDDYGELRRKLLRDMDRWQR